MRCIAKYIDSQHPPMLQLNIFDAPHRRMHIEVIRQYRQIIFDAVKATGVDLPISHPIDISVLFVNPSSPDLGNLFLALEQSLDGKTMSSHNAVLEDDSLVSKVTMAKFFPYGNTSPIAH